MHHRALAGSLWFALLVWACAILWLSSLTPQEMPDAAFVLWDKMNHVAAFAVGGWLAASSLGLTRPTASPVGRIVLAVLAVIAVAAFGALDEAVQTFTPGRAGGDIYDWVADLLGATAGAALSLAAFGRLERLAR